MLKKIALIFFLFFLNIVVHMPLSAQYFGRNKPSYKTFEFQLYQSPNFDFYHYFDNDSVVNALANTYEKWYIRHQKVFKDTFDTQNPIILYENHPDFQQTTAVGSMINIGTQGVTEALRNRVVMPVLETNAQTDHVIGHELVHVFQFRAMFVHDTLGLNALRNLPLWLVEGMAEYFSIGSIDAHTAMIMRDAYYSDDFPTLKQMTRNYKYNPYRYGHSFVAFLGRTWGDSLIVPLFRQTARFGYERGIERVIGLNSSTVSTMWKNAIENHFSPFAADSARHVPIGETLISRKNSGRMNISPSLSPDGKYMAFFSEKDLFSIDLFLANAKTGKIIRKLNSSMRNTDIDGFNFFESVGAWSPDGKQLAYIIVKKGRNKIVISNVSRWRRTKEIKVEGVDALNNPVWSPDGESLVFNGLVGGVPDLFLYEIKSGKVTNLTNDRYSYIHAAWAPDGKLLASATDKPQKAQSDKPNNFKFNLATINLEKEDYPVNVIDVFPDADNLNPLFSTEQSGLYFLSNSDGFRNLFYYNFDSGEVFRLTDYYTGISGITHLSPAVSIARETGELAYSYYRKGEYVIVTAKDSDFEKVKVDPMVVDFTAATLPPLERPNRPIVDKQLVAEPAKTIFPKDSFNILPYKSRFGLTYIGNTGVGVSTSRYGTGMAGGVAMLFSDIVGDHQLYTMLAINGEIYDFGGMVAYMNQKRKINWGGSISHIPYVFGGIRLIDEQIDVEDETITVQNLQYIIHRTFEDQISTFGYYPISSTRRIEIGGSWAWYYYRMDAFNRYYYNGMILGESRERLPAPDGFSLQRLNIAYVGDNSYFGLASPNKGQRYRFNVEKYFGKVDMYSVIADYRWYYFLNPVSIAFRTTHYGRWFINEEKDDLFYPLFLGYPGFLRGYDYSALHSRHRDSSEENFFEHYIGDRIFLGGFEIRLPFTGPERLAVIKSGIFFTELALFLDAGIAWSKNQSITFNPSEASLQNRTPYFSTGPALRINLFGALILEPFYAIPFTLNEFDLRNATWGVNFLPGW